MSTDTYDAEVRAALCIVDLVKPVHLPSFIGAERYAKLAVRAARAETSLRDLLCGLVDDALDRP